MLLPTTLTQPTPFIFATIIIRMIWSIHVIAPKTFINNCATARTLLSKSQHPIIASRFINFFLKPIFYNLTTCRIMVFLLTTFETKFPLTFTHDVLFGYKGSFFAKNLTTSLRAPFCILVVVCVISVVPEHIFIMRFVFITYLFNSFWSWREELKK